MVKKLTLVVEWSDDVKLNRTTMGEKLEEAMYKPDVSMFDELETGMTGSLYWDNDGTEMYWTIL